MQQKPIWFENPLLAAAKEGWLQQGALAFLVKAPVLQTGDPGFES